MLMSHDLHSLTHTQTYTGHRHTYTDRQAMFSMKGEKNCVATSMCAATQRHVCTVSLFPFVLSTIDTPSERNTKVLDILFLTHLPCYLV